MRCFNLEVVKKNKHTHTLTLVARQKVRTYIILLRTGSLPCLATKSAKRLIFNVSTAGIHFRPRELSR